MKKAMVIIASIVAMGIASCNNEPSVDNGKKNAGESNTAQDEATSGEAVRKVQATFQSVDPGISGFVKALVHDYLDVKNALTEGNESGAAAAAKEITAAINGLDKSLFTAVQKKAYDDVEGDLKASAGKIADSKIEDQRQQFSTMSNSVYAIVKAFGAGITLYHDHCPMAMNNNGAMWLSETREIRNPYFGKKMMSCGSVEEMFQ